MALDQNRHGSPGALGGATRGQPSKRLLRRLLIGESSLHANRLLSVCSGQENGNSGRTSPGRQKALEWGVKPLVRRHGLRNVPILARLAGAGPATPARARRPPYRRYSQIRQTEEGHSDELPLVKSCPLEDSLVVPLGRQEEVVA